MPRTAATTSRSGPTIRRSRMRCPRWRSESGKWGSPRRTSWKRDARRSAWPSLGLERQSLHEPRQVRPRFAVRACDRLEGRRVLPVGRHALRHALFEGRHVFVLVEDANRDSVSPFPRFLERLRRLLLHLGRFPGPPVVAFLLALLDAGHCLTP